MAFGIQCRVASGLTCLLIRSRGHSLLSCRLTQRSSALFHGRPSNRPRNVSRVRPACGIDTSSVLTGRSYGLELESGKLYKTDIMNSSVGEIRADLAARNADTRGIKKVIAERLFSLLQDEAEQLRLSRSAGALPQADERAKLPPRSVRTRAQMAQKLQLRSMSEPAKRGKRARSKAQIPNQPSLASEQPQAQQLPGARAAQMVRMAMMSKIAKASMLSAQQKQQQEGGTALPRTFIQTEQQDVPQPPLKPQHAQQAPTELAWEAEEQPSASPQASQEEISTSPLSRDQDSTSVSNQDSHTMQQTSQQASRRHSQAADSLGPALQHSSATADPPGAPQGQAPTGSALPQAQASAQHTQSEASGTAASTSYNSSTIWRASSIDQEVVNSNATGMQISFLGTASSMNCKTRSPSCIAVRAHKAVMLFDCGEDAQRQLLKQPQIVHGKVNRIFVTDLSSTSIYGIPGMLCTLSWARERGFENADIPLHVYGPPGLAGYIRTMLLLSDTYSMVPILVHEFQEAACNQQPELILKRARLYRVMLPPNQLNPQGYYDGTLDAAFLSRYDKKKKGGKSDLRASARQIPLPAPGDPTQQGVDRQSMSWTISCDQETAVTAFPLPPAKPALACWGYCLQEADRAGTLDVAKAQQLGVSPGPAYGALKAGEPVSLPDGTTVVPEQVVGPNQPGRKVVILGRTSNSLAAATWAQGADCVVLGYNPQHEQDSAKLAASDSEDWAALLKTVDAGQIILTRLSDDLGTADSAIRAVTHALPLGANVQAAYDQMVLCLDRRHAAAV